MQKIVITVAGLVIVVLGAWYMFQQKSGQVACTADAMLCSDGTYVGRTGPNCQFVCPEPVVAASGSTGGIVAFDSGIRGTVLAGPTCPVEQTPADPNCADKPLATNVVIYRKSDLARPVIVTTSNKEGAFSADLPPGEYVVRGGEAVMPSCTDTPALVSASKYTTIQLNCDTGIR